MYARASLFYRELEYNSIRIFNRSRGLVKFDFIHKTNIRSIVFF